MAVTVIKALYNILPSINIVKFIKKNTYFFINLKYLLQNPLNVSAENESARKLSFNRHII
ncbi:MAG: hypothetical protein AB2L14_30245 [Candidatus Xenobiia bacterium LiM19]